MLNRDLNARLGWYRCEASLTRNPTIAQSAAGAALLLRQNMDELFNLSSSMPASEIVAVRAEMAAEAAAGLQLTND